MRRGSEARKANPRPGIEQEIVGEVCTVRATRCMHRASSLRVDGGWLADGWRVRRIGPGGGRLMRRSRWLQFCSRCRSGTSHGTI